MLSKYIPIMMFMVIMAFFGVAMSAVVRANPVRTVEPVPQYEVSKIGPGTFTGQPLYPATLRVPPGWEPYDTSSGDAVYIRRRIK